MGKAAAQMSAVAQYHFILSRSEASAVIELANNSSFKETGPFAVAATKLDEQMAEQTRSWEVCEACNGTGWVEDGPTRPLDKPPGIQNV